MRPALVPLLLLAPALAAQDDGYELARHFLGDYPSEANPGFHEDIQGVTHDDDHWYFTQTLHLWKVPVGQDLAGDVATNPDTLIQFGGSHSSILGDGFDHYGDCSYHEVTVGGAQKGYVVVPLTGPGKPPQVAVFRASDLVYLGRDELWLDGSGTALGVTPDGHVWSTLNADSTKLNEYHLNFEELEDPVSPQPVTLTHVAVHSLQNADGTPHGPIPIIQGMAFSESGGTLYISNGFMTGDSAISCGGTDAFTEAEMQAIGGIRAFDASTMKLIEKSTHGGGLFDYSFEPGFPDCEEPEGLTWWDLDDKSAPGITGTLHVTLLDNDAPDDDDLYFKHYTNRVHVGGGFPAETSTVQAAHDFAWNGSEIVVAPGSYGESLILDKRVVVKSLSGSAVIGQ